MFLPQGVNSLANNPFFNQSEAGQALQHSPLGFIDIGARGGAHDMVDPMAKQTAVLAFEPDKAECERLMQNEEVYGPWAAFKMVPIALADKKAQAELVLLSCATNHSLLAPNKAFTSRYNMEKWTEVGREALETETLDTVLFSSLQDNNNWGEFIKLDTQGTEFEILQGAKRTLTERTVAVVTEVAFCELYEKQKLFSEVELYLRELGFAFYGFTKIHTRSCKQLDKQFHMTVERAFYADAIFFKDPLPGLRNKPTLNKRSLYTLYTSALLLGYYDYALELAKFIWAAVPKQLALAEQLIKQLSHYQPEHTQTSIAELAKAVEKQPEFANLTVGSFIDQRRMVCNYDDMFKVTPLPKTL